MISTTLYIHNLGGDAASFEKYFEKFSTNYKDMIKISIADGEHHKVPDHRIKAIFREISALPNLREIRLIRHFAVNLMGLYLRPSLVGFYHQKSVRLRS